MYNHNKAQQSKNRVHISWDILYAWTNPDMGKTAGTKPQRITTKSIPCGSFLAIILYNKMEIYSTW